MKNLIAVLSVLVSANAFAQTASPKEIIGSNMENVTIACVDSEGTSLAFSTTDRRIWWHPKAELTQEFFKAENRAIEFQFDSMDSSAPGQLHIVGTFFLNFENNPFISRIDS